MTRDGRFLRLSAITMAGLRGPSDAARPLGVHPHAQMPVFSSLAEGASLQLANGDDGDRSIPYACYL